MTTSPNLIYVPPWPDAAWEEPTLLPGSSEMPPLYWPTSAGPVPAPEDADPDPAITISGTCHITVDGYSVQAAMSRADVLARLNASSSAPGLVWIALDLTNGGQVLVNLEALTPIAVTA